jgi:hypothetical protein
MLSDGVVLAGRTQYGIDEPNKGNHSVLLKKFTFNGDALEQVTNTGIIGIDQNEQPHSNQSGYYTVFFNDLKFNIQNFGEDTINTVKVNLEFPQIDTTCSNGYQRFSRKYGNLSVMPGETVELLWDELTVTFEQDPTGLTSFCAWTSQPNLKGDTDNTNDLYCYDFLVDNEEEVPLDIFVVYPNPATDFLNINIQPSIPFANTKIQVTDISGRNYCTLQNILEKETYTIPVFNWPNGLYFVHYFENGIPKVSKKLVLAK